MNKANHLVKIGVLVALFIGGWQLMEPTRRYGAIWDSQVHPTQAEVVFLHGETVTGLLSKSWHGDFVLAAADGRNIIFPRFERITLEPVTTEFSIYKRWRTYFPAVLLTSLMTTAGLCLAVLICRRDR